MTTSISPKGKNVNEYQKELASNPAVIRLKLTSGQTVKTVELPSNAPTADRENIIHRLFIDSFDRQRPREYTLTVYGKDSKILETRKFGTTPIPPSQKKNCEKGNSCQY